MASSLEVTLAFSRPGAGTEVVRYPSWLSQPPPRPRYQPSPASAGVLRAAAATVAMASKRSFIFLTLAQNTDGQVPPANFVRNQCSVYNGDRSKCLHRRCCFAADKPSQSKVLLAACDTGATARKATDPNIGLSTTDNSSNLND